MNGYKLDSEEYRTYLTIEGFVNTLPDQEREKVRECVAKIEATMGAFSPHHSALAISLLGARLAAIETD
jgi:hypothetical protein